jgi:type I site-specific restriction-modification system R (restriction) subunit
MHARVSRFAGLDPERLDATVEQFKSGMLPQLQAQQGFKGMTVAVNRRNGQAIAIALYESERDMRDSEKLAAQARSEAVESGSHQPSRDPLVDHYEVVVQI